MRDMIRQIVSAYQSIKLEGQGDGYVLFVGKEPDSKQPVTIKVLGRTLSKDPKIAARFRALSQTIRQLNHPNIATIRDVGEKAGLPYVVTRVIERAKPLTDRLNQPWAVDEAADLTMQVGQALEHAYNKGLVHGSLSPEGVTVQPDGKVAVGDFGLAQLLDLTGVQLKRAASPYTAPERTAGQAPDPRSDVYSLAAILYTLLAHRPPQVVQGQVLTPGRFNPDVPPAMDNLVVKALALNPAGALSRRQIVPCSAGRRDARAGRRQGPDPPVRWREPGRAEGREDQAGRRRPALSALRDGEPERPFLPHVRQSPATAGGDQPNPARCSDSWPGRCRTGRGAAHRHHLAAFGCSKGGTQYRTGGGTQYRTGSSTWHRKRSGTSYRTGSGTTQDSQGVPGAGCPVAVQSRRADPGHQN